MIDKTLLIKTVEEAIEGLPLFVVDVNVAPDNRLLVEIDSTEGGVDIDTCVDITRHIESVFDRDVEDYELEVGSAGLTSPFKVMAQYVKNIGNPVEVVTRDGRKLKGTLTDVDTESRTFVLTVVQKVKEPGAKRPVAVETPLTLAADDCKSVRYMLDFK